MHKTWEETKKNTQRNEIVKCSQQQKETFMQTQLFLQLLLSVFLSLISPIPCIIVYIYHLFFHGEIQMDGCLLVKTFQEMQYMTLNVVHLA